MRDFLQELHGGGTDLDEVRKKRFSHRRCRVVEQTQKRVPSGFTEFYRFHVPETKKKSPISQSGNFLVAELYLLRGAAGPREFATYCRGVSRAPKRAVPMRTTVLPAAIAAAKSPLIPID